MNQPSPLKPMPLWLAALMFAVPSALATWGFTLSYLPSRLARPARSCGGICSSTSGRWR